MLKIKSFRFALLSCTGVGILGIFIALYVFSANFDTVTGGDATEILFIWPDYQIEGLSNEKIQEEMTPILQALDSWAKKNHASILLKPQDSVGVAVIDYSGWIKQNYGIDYSGEKQKTAIIKKGTILEKVHTKNALLFPDDYNYRIIGTYSDKNRKEENYANQFFYSFWDYKNSNDTASLLHIYGAEKAELSALTEEMQNLGVMTNYLHHSNEPLGNKQNFIQIFLEDNTACFMLFSFIGIILCTFLALFLFYHCASKNLSIRHLYGATYSNIFKIICFYYNVATIFGIAIGFLLGKNMLDISDERKVSQIGATMGAFVFIVTFLLHIISYFFWYLQHAKRKGGLKW